MRVLIDTNVVLDYCVIAQSLDAIVTHDTQDFSNATVPVLSVSQLLEQLE